MANIKLSPEVREVLEQSIVTENGVILPKPTLPPTLYKAVDKALNNIGCHWNRKAQAHLSNSDPRQKFQQMLESGQAIDEKKLYQSFYTPKPLAREVALIADVKGKAVLDPEAGEGALADACMEAGAFSVNCIEIRPEACAILRQKYPSNTVEADFLSLIPAPIYDRVVMNPPFTGNQDIKHVDRALHWLKPGGKLVAIMPDSQSRAAFQSLIAGRDYQITELERGTFKQSGTDIKTLILTIK